MNTDGLVGPTTFFSSIGDLARDIIKHRELAWELTRRDIADRYVGQAFGWIWAIAHPLILMGVYVFIFALVFRVKMGGTIELPLDYTAYILSGLIPWLAFVESMNRSASVIVASSNLVKQVVFPIEILPLKVVLASFVTQAVGTTVLVIYVLAQHGSLHWTYLLMPPLLVLQFMAMLGVAYILSSLGVYFRDIKDFVQVFGTVALFIMPAFYMPHQVPTIFKPLVYLNPFSYMVWCYQDVFYYGRFEHPWAWAVFAVLSVAAVSFGYLLFKRLSVAFGNVL